MLGTVVHAHYAELTTLARSWAEAGASSFSIWEQQQMLAHWPAQQAQQAPRAPTLIAPIRVGTATLGHVRVDGVSDSTARARLAADADLLARFVVLETELQQLAADLTKGQDQLLGLYELAQSIAGHTTIGGVLHCLAFEAARMLHAQGGFTIFMPNEGMPLLAQYPEQASLEDTLWCLFWETHADERELLLPNGGALDVFLGEMQNLLLIPVRLRGKLRGAMGVFNRAAGSFTSADIKLAHAIVQHASAHLENVLLYQEILERARLEAELDLARRVQSSLFPQQLPHVPSLDIFATSRPAFQVGGDFYMLVSRPDRPFVFAIGDISGKGLSAALLMTMTRTAMHSKASFMPYPMPDAVMRHSNEDLYEDFARVGMFATAFVGYYEQSQQRIVYANAGHSPVIYRPHDGSARLLRADSTALGIMPVNRCENHGVPMRPGDIMVVATDGLSDARDPRGLPFGDDRLVSLIDACADQSARDIGERLLAAVEQFEDGGPREDDQTLVIIKGAVS
jgi:sigma-B regulation protein RsbU (phosphoserine phosphatase)